MKLQFTSSAPILFLPNQNFSRFSRTKHRLLTVQVLQKGDRGSVDRISLDLFSWSKVSVKFGVWSNAFFVTWSKVSLIFDKFWQLIKTFINYFGGFFAWSKLLLMSYFKLLINCQNLQVIFWHLIESSNNGILGFLKLSMNCQKRTYGFWQLIKLLAKK